MHLVWFKRDLRIVDHAPLFEALKKGNVLPLYIIEPELWQQEDMSYRHYMFLRECLEELNEELSQIGQGLIIKSGDAIKVMEYFLNNCNITALWSHQETWNGWTYKRDLKVKKFLKEYGIPWNEFEGHGVIRRLHDRNGWASKWYQKMKKTILSAPKKLSPQKAVSEPIPAAEKLGLINDNCIYRQKGGRKEGLKLLNSYLLKRGENYSKEMSSPLTAFESCSRLSTHLAFGTLSMREVFHATQKRTDEIKNLPKSEKGSWPIAMRSFSGRLRWHCHFIQKLEDEPRIEFENMHSAYDGVRDDEFNYEYFEAWKAGKTGYPMVDACMRALKATGWLNFRMRAMLMSFASYHLWLHWRKPALYLARLFTDYEPGIHYSQCQMQSGTTGINTIRIYNPIKQGIDHDPHGLFIKKWVKELVDMPKEDIHTPWQNGILLNDYPMPIVEEKTARKKASEKLYALRKSTQHKSEALFIVNKHGSRKPQDPRVRKQKKTKKDLTSKRGAISL